jgi:hypothetical protein|tara:strand:- start:56 stop:301 length:246 start_codon:yes stop_codon:yes gene_type:complete
MKKEFQKCRKQSFSAFRKALAYARSKSQLLGHSVKIERDDNCFVVIFDQVSNLSTIKAQNSTALPHHFNCNHSHLSPTPLI